MNEFYNKNIVITGASSGIGLSTAFYFLNSNANVVLACQDEKSISKICNENNFSNAVILKADLEKKSQVDYFLSIITKLFPTIDVLINCAGIKLDNDIEKTYQQDFDYTINTNLRSVFLILKELRPYFSQGASVINLSCLYGTRPMVGVISYAMSKSGLETLTRYAAAEMANLNIRINAISGCPVKTNSFRYLKISEDDIKYFNKKMEYNIPLGRIAHVDDIVKVIIFLASSRSSKITGQIIKVDGGRSLTSSGYVHYKGLNNMNVVFEPDTFKINSIFNIYLKNGKKLDKPITDKNELKKFVDENIVQSNFATNKKDAFYHPTANYYPVKENDSRLTDRYLKGSLPNMLFDNNKNRFATMSYNPGQRIFNDLPKVEKNIFKSQIDKGKFEEDNNNFNFQKYSKIDNDIEENNNENENEEKEKEKEKEKEGTIVKEETFEEEKEQEENEKEDNEKEEKEQEENEKEENEKEEKNEDFENL